MKKKVLQQWYSSQYAPESHFSNCLDNGIVSQPLQKSKVCLKNSEDTVLFNILFCCTNIPCGYNNTGACVYIWNSTKGYPRGAYNLKPG